MVGTGAKGALIYISALSTVPPPHRFRSSPRRQAVAVALAVVVAVPSPSPPGRRRRPRRRRRRRRRRHRRLLRAR